MDSTEFKNRRKALGLTQDELGKLLGVSKRTIINYEKGEVIPKTKGELLHHILNQKSEVSSKNLDYDNEKSDNLVAEPTQQIAQNNKDLTRVGEVVNNNKEAQVIVKPIIRKEIPFFDIDFYCNFRIGNRKDLTPTFVFYHPDFDRAEFAVRNSGQSMSSVLGCRDVIGMREVHDWHIYFPQGEIYGIVTTNDMKTVKVVRESKDKTKFMLIPKPSEEHKNDFPEFEEIPKECVLHLFQVVANMCVNRLAM